MDRYGKYNDNFKQVICRNIRKYRKQSGLSVLKVSELVDVTPEYFKRIESLNDPRKSCSLNMLYKLSIIFDKKLDDFLNDEFEEINNDIYDELVNSSRK